MGFAINSQGVVFHASKEGPFILWGYVIIWGYFGYLLKL